MEEIAIKQQGELETLNNSVDAIKKAIAYGAAGSAGFQSMYSLATTGLKNKLFDEKEGYFGGKEIQQAEYWREATEKVTGKIGDGVDYVKNAIKDIKSISDAWTKVGEMAGKTLELITNFKDNYTNFMKELEGVKTQVNTELKSEGKVELVPLSYQNKTEVNSNLTTSNLTNTSSETNTNTIAKTETTLNNNINVNVSLDEASKNQALTTIVNNALTKYFENPSNISDMAKAGNNVKTSNGNVLSNVS